MRRQVCFSYQDKRYVTIFGCGDYLSTVKQEWPNIADVMAIMLKSGFSTSFNKEFGLNIRSVPDLTDVRVTSLGADGIIVNGVLTEPNGDTHEVMINKTGLYIDGKLEGEETEEQSTPESARTSGPEIEETKEHESDAVKEPVKKEDPKPENTVESEQKLDVKNDTTTESVKTAAPSADDHIDMSVGFHMGVVNTHMEERQFGRGSISHDGFTIHARPVYKAVERPMPKPVEHVEVVADDKVSAESLPIDPEIENAPDKPVATVPNEVLQRLSNRWAPNQMSDQPKREDSPQKQIKDRLRSKFSPEVNAVIGDIPHLLLDDISEFTMNPVDYSALKDSGVSYCIQQHWHKCGNWFCIDVVSSRKRVFYNSKKNLVVDIPVEDCKAWLKAVS